MKRLLYSSDSVDERSRFLLLCAIRITRNETTIGSGLAVRIRGRLVRSGVVDERVELVVVEEISGCVLLWCWRHSWCADRRLEKRGDRWEEAACWARASAAVATY